MRRGNHGRPDGPSGASARLPSLLHCPEAGKSSVVHIASGPCHQFKIYRAIADTRIVAADLLLQPLSISKVVAINAQ